MTGQLTGHNAQVTAVGVVKDTPLLISADEIGFIKTWDIRNMSCFQTIHFESKGSIKSFLYVSAKKFIGADIRLHWFEFEDDLVVNANGIELYSVTPIAAQFSQASDELLIATRSDVRILDIFTGKVKKILANVRNENADISHMELYPNHKKFILGDTQGNIVTYDKHNGTTYTQNIGHNNEISSIL
jgi:WD40 repeat protein